VSVLGSSARTYLSILVIHKLLEDVMMFRHLSLVIATVPSPEEVDCRYLKFPIEIGG
jgi:hypothetical protein